jgi:hypothetical protein
MGVSNYLLGLASNLDPPISASQVARNTGLSHQLPAMIQFLTVDMALNKELGEKKRVV